jgi:hypothetical protein
MTNTLAYGSIELVMIIKKVYTSHILVEIERKKNIFKLHNPNLKILD